MVTIPAGARVLLATRPIDFRKGGHSLAALAQEVLAEDPFSGAVIVYRAKRGDRVKILVWDTGGLVLIWKQLQQGSFRWPPIMDGVMKLSPVEFAALFDGLDWTRVQALRALVLATLAERDATMAERDAVASERDILQAQNDRLRHLLLKLTRMQFGAKSERLPEEQLQLGLEALEQAVAQGDAKAEKRDPELRQQQAAKRRASRGALPAQFRVIVTRRPKLACRACPGTVLQEPAPARLIEGGLPTEALVAHVLVARYADHLPPLLGAMRIWFEAQLARLPARGPTAEAIRYALNHWEGLQRFLDDGRIELDNNSIERAMRPVCLSRKNSLFAGSDEGGASWANLASLIETCKLNSVNPQAYFADLLKRLVNGWPQNRIDELMPWHWAPKQPP